MPPARARVCVRIYNNNSNDIHVLYTFVWPLSVCARVCARVRLESVQYNNITASGPSSSFVKRRRVYRGYVTARRTSADRGSVWTRALADKQRRRRRYKWVARIPPPRRRRRLADATTSFLVPGEYGIIRDDDDYADGYDDDDDDYNNSNMPGRGASSRTTRAPGNLLENFFGAICALNPRPSTVIIITIILYYVCYNSYYPKAVQRFEFFLKSTKRFSNSFFKLAIKSVKLLVLIRSPSSQTFFRLRKCKRSLPIISCKNN